MFSKDAGLCDLPVVADVDVVVVGATAAAVSFALAAKEAGASVFLISSRSYLGEDICGMFRFWPEADIGNALAREVFPQQGAVPTPMHVKLTLEQRLVAASIPFVFNSFPAGLLRGESGAVAGVAMANRSGLQAVAARAVVDATLDGMVLRQAGYQHTLHSLQGVQAVSYAVFCLGEGVDAEGVESIEHLAGYRTERYEVSARRYRLRVDCADGGPQALANAYGEVVERCRVSQEYRHQVRILPLLPQSDAIPSSAALRLEYGLYGLTEALRLSEGAEAAFCNPLSAMRVAEGVAAEVTLSLPDPVGGALRVDCSGSVPVHCGNLHAQRDALRAERTALFDSGKLPVLGHFDVVVVGGGTGGAPAAIAAGRNGAQTLVIELTSALGGVGTMGQITRYWHGNRVGFTAQIDSGVSALEASDALKASEGSWSVSAKSFWYHREGRKAGCTYWFNTLCAGVCVDDGRVTAVLVAGPYGYGLVETGCVVDSTGCADIPAAAGAPTVVIGAEHVAVQGTGLAGVVPGLEARNSDHTFSDDTDTMDVTAMLVATKLKFKGDFDCGELVDSRERRQIVGDYSINALDILYDRSFPDTICRATSNFDSHGFTIDPVFMLKPADKNVALWANVPLRCLLPRGLDGVLVTGLGISAHRDALPVVRMQPDVQNQGYAAGYIAALSALRKTAIRDLDIREIQRHLVAMGNLPPEVLEGGDSFPLSDEAVQRAVAEEWDSLQGIALILYDPQRSLPVLRKAYLDLRGVRSVQSLCYAQLLALLNADEGSAELLETLARRPWDEGWRFRGMHQFGETLSELDKILICLGRVADRSAWPAVLAKIETLAQDVEFSHIRALAICCETLFARHPDARVAPALAGLLRRPGYCGHAQCSLAEVQSALTDDINENRVRDRALRELHLARALYRCGDQDSIGHDILMRYTADLRGHFARHARAVLKERCAGA